MYYDEIVTIALKTFFNFAITGQSMVSKAVYEPVNHFLNLEYIRRRAKKL